MTLVEDLDLVGSDESFVFREEAEWGGELPSTEVLGGSHEEDEEAAISSAISS